MKTITLHRYLLLVLSVFFTGSILMAQVVESEQKKQHDIQTDEMKAKMKMLKALQAEEINARKEMREMERQHAEHASIAERSARESSRARTSSWSRYAAPSSGDYPDEYYLIGSQCQEIQSQLTLRKSFREATSTSKGEFEVDSNIRQFRCMICGSVRSGEIFVGIEYPDGKTFKELIINPSADINFSQSISFKEGEDKKYVGNWNYVIKADKAEGNYLVQIMTQ